MHLVRSHPFHQLESVHAGHVQIGHDGANWLVSWFSSISQAWSPLDCRHHLQTAGWS